MMNNSKKILVTGASNGIGLALTKKLLVEGMEVFAVTRSGEILGLTDARLTVIKGDISNEASIREVAEALEKHSVKLDYLVNNAGVGVDLGDEIPTAELMRISFDTNSIGTVLFTEAMIPHLTDGSHIVFLSTAMALLRNVGPSAPAYRMSKAALNVYAVMLSHRLAAHNIKVTPLHPGWVQTRMGGETAPVTIEDSVNGIYKAITENTETGKFWNVDIAATEEY
ncbi:NAD(P)-dependent dehydrogenase, short-chain alcohol dehydrogenase family [Pedobacter westerhofensis]|uniref:NAD(P)-dependent dehydrogenase, short-chain alcohol dehydrogenase family n=2 Tax=Pedobacter westerhofensis TaxID=425512 RepID=A0A521FL68_9SPHI|nr:NAD(P)-dependent dehydrogenase, short-chain alcohol dehydrogenase family [Pedobacter westerhofensis]